MKDKLKACRITKDTILNLTDFMSLMVVNSNVSTVQTFLETEIAIFDKESGLFYRVNGDIARQLIDKVEIKSNLITYNK